MAENSDLSMVIDEMKLVLEYQLMGVDSTKETAKSIFTSASLMIALIGALQILRPVPQEVLQLYFILMAITALLYIVLISLCVIVLAPANLHTPIEPTWETLQDYFIGKDGRDLLRIQLSAYLNAIKLNQPILNLKRSFTTIANILFPLIVLLLLILAVLPSVDQLRQFIPR